MSRGRRRRRSPKPASGATAKHNAPQRERRGEARCYKNRRSRFVMSEPTVNARLAHFTHLPRGSADGCIQYTLTSPN